MDKALMKALDELKCAVNASVRAAYGVAQTSYDGSDTKPGILAAEDVARKFEAVMLLLDA